jgi:curli biogenesis system outer membrane secretion channel CsgG
MISLRPALLAAVGSALLTACASAPAPMATASLPVVAKKSIAAAPAKKPAAPVATAYDGVGSKFKCGERHLAYQAGKSPEATMQEKVARDLECTPL